MAIFRKINTSFWSDSFISDLDREQKLFYVYLLTNERTRQCGVYEITKKQISYDLGYSIDTVSILLQYFIKSGKIKYNDVTKELAIGNWLKYNGSTSPKVVSCIDKEFKLIKDTVLIQYVKSMDTHPQEEQEEEQEEEQYIYIEDKPQLKNKQLEIPLKPKKEKKKKESSGKEKDETKLPVLKTKLSLEEREKIFYNDIGKFLEEYSATTLRKFFDYWSEKNKEKGKMKFEMERTFEISKRLRTWKSNEDKFKTPQHASTKAAEDRDSISDLSRIADEHLRAVSQDVYAGF